MDEKKAAEICRQFYLGDVARKLLTPDLTAEEYLQLLIQNKQYVDAVRVLAYALPTRQAIMWASWCARQFSEANPSDSFSAALADVDKWLAEPNEENRRAAMKAAERVEFGTPAGSAALAVFFSGGTLGPPDAPVIEPQKYLTPNAVVGSVLLAALLKEPEKAEQKYQAFIAEGQKIAARR
ncbi:MAG TPA: hypothetical protein DCK99_09680 [Blastocatellia bacterium]|nr:hypothetical protein [Blastocatellia bacterium]